MFLGIDIGTSGAKAVIVDGDGAVAAQTTAPIPIMRPHPDWSEQNPADWWTATCGAVLELPATLRTKVEAIGLAGQMHGATLIGDNDQPLRPAILWNDGRSDGQCQELERREPKSRSITGNAAMPGFTAPKLLWVCENEPDIFAATRHILLPKDYVRLCMTGDKATDLSDASGTLWLDVGKRRWSPDMLAACDLLESHMPTLHEGNAVTGQLRAEIAAEWGMTQVPVAAGGGDNAAGAVGAGVVTPGRAFLSLGTSGVLFAATDAFAPAPDQGAHAFCHALPDRWHQMAVLLSAASALDWASNFGRFWSVTAALESIKDRVPFAGPEIFLPYLSGERTPHNDPHARGTLIGLTHDSRLNDMVMAVLEGVAFAFADGLDVLEAAGARIDEIQVIGGGAKAAAWGPILATALGRPLIYASGGEVGPAYGAARLARLALTGEDIIAVCKPVTVDHIVNPDPALETAAQAKRARFRNLYPALKGHFS
jgi:xylulokinase